MMWTGHFLTTDGWQWHISFYRSKQTHSLSLNISTSSPSTVRQYQPYSLCQTFSSHISMISLTKWKSSKRSERGVLSSVIFFRAWMCWLLSRSVTSNDTSDDVSGRCVRCCSHYISCPLHFSDNVTINSTFANTTWGFGEKQLFVQCKNWSCFTVKILQDPHQDIKIPT